jgi:hypothetical protein
VLLLFKLLITSHVIPPCCVPLPVSDTTFAACCVPLPVSDTTFATFDSVLYVTRPNPFLGETAAREKHLREERTEAARVVAKEEADATLLATKESGRKDVLAAIEVCLSL